MVNESSEIQVKNLWLVLKENDDVLRNIIVRVFSLSLCIKQSPGFLTVWFSVEVVAHVS